MIRLLFVAILLSFFLPAHSVKPFTKPAKPASARKAAYKPEIIATADTVRDVPSDSVAVAGFEKTLRSPRESMYITNHTANPISGIEIEITYKDMSGRMLHKADHFVAIDIPSRETRLVEVQSFDRQGLYFYHLSPVPRRASRATPFNVALKVNYILTPKNDNL